MAEWSANRRVIVTISPELRLVTQTLGLYSRGLEGILVTVSLVANIIRARVTEIALCARDQSLLATLRL